MRASHRGLGWGRYVRFAAAAGVVALCLTSSAWGLTATDFIIANVGGAGGEPSIAAGPGGNLYVSYPGAGMAFYRSTNGGASWIPGGTADGSSGDTTVNVDSSGAVYQSNLNMIKLGTNTLQGDVYKSLDFGDSWTQKGKMSYAAGIGQSNATGQPFLVDRQWTDAWIPAGGNTDQARVYIAYHDWGPNQIWVNASTDGGRNFGPPIDVIAASPLAQASSFCDTVPGGLKVVQSGPRAGRVYVAWLAADAATNAATGCNVTQMNSFYQVWIAYSDNADAAVPIWTSQVVFNGLPTHDAATCFADLALDNQGNPYVAFSDRLGITGGEWDVYVMASFDGGTTWNGSPLGLGAPYKVNVDTGTHFFPAIAAGDPGKVVVAYLGTPTVISTLPYGKPSPGGGNGASWYLYAAQSLSLTSGSPSWSVAKVTSTPMHVGDICTLGIFCMAGEPLGANRNLLDFIDIAVDPQGKAHIAYTDDQSGWIKVANQTGGIGVGAP